MHYFLCWLIVHCSIFHMKKAAVNIFVQDFVLTCIFGSFLGKYQGTWSLDYMSDFNFLRNWQTVFQSGCTISHTHQQWMRVPVAPQSHQHLLSSVQILTIVICVWWYLSVVLICISLMMYKHAASFHMLICQLCIYFGGVSSSLWTIF